MITCILWSYGIKPSNTENPSYRNTAHCWGICITGECLAKGKEQGVVRRVNDIQETGSTDILNTQTHDPNKQNQN